MNKTEIDSLKIPCECRYCGYVPKIDFEVAVTYRFKFAKARLLHFCGDLTIEFSVDGGFRKKDADVADVREKVLNAWNTLNRKAPPEDEA